MPTRSVVDAFAKALENELRKIASMVVLPGEDRTRNGELVVIRPEEKLSLSLSVDGGSGGTMNFMVLVNDDGSCSAFSDGWVVEFGHIRKADLSKVAQELVRGTIASDVMCT